MRINADFSKPATVRFAEGAWTPSPMRGVERRMLDRIGEEVARATTIVRFAPGAEFHPHTHDGGEEFLVLDGVFEDEHGAFPAGSYIRNPPTSHHAPAAPEGTTILVKLHQMDPADRTHVRLDATGVEAVGDPERPGVSVRPLFADAREQVRLEDWAPGTAAGEAAPGGLEAFVLSGALDTAEGPLGPWDWLRLPPGARFEGTAGPAGARLWVKSGHLAGLG